MQHRLVSLDDLVGAREDQGRDLQAQSLGGLQIDDELEFGRLINRDVARFGPFEDRVRPLVRDFCEYALKLSRRRLREHHADYRSLQLSTCLTKQLLAARGCAR